MRAGRFILLIVAVAVFASAAYAGSPGKIALTGTEVFDPFGLLGAPIGEFIDFGTVECPGHKPTGDPAQPCPVGSRTHTRNTIWKSRYDSTDDRFDGWFLIVANGNYAPDFTGAGWGTFTLIYDDTNMGVMTGSWQGVSLFQDGVWVIPMHAAGRIYGGPFDGAVAVVKAQLTRYTPLPAAYVSEHDGVLITVP